MKPVNTAMKIFLSQGGVAAVPRYLEAGSLRGRFQLYGKGQVWSDMLRHKLTKLGFMDFDRGPLNACSGNGGAFSVCVYAPKNFWDVAKSLVAERARSPKSSVRRTNPIGEYNKAEAYFKEDAPMTEFGALPFAYGVAYKYVDGHKAGDPWHPIYASNSKQHCLDDMSVRARSRGNKAFGLLYRVEGGISIQIHYDSKKEQPRANPALRRANGELHERMKSTLSRVGLPFLHIDCYGRQITIETKSKDTAQKWAAVLARFSKVRGMLETFAYNKVNRGTVLLPTRHKIWRVYAVMGEK